MFPAATLHARSILARMILVLPATLAVFTSQGVCAATNNPEAASPQRARPAAAQTPPVQTASQTVRPQARPIVQATPPRATQAGLISAPKAAVGTAAINVARPTAARTVSVPVLGREGPAAAAPAPRARQIAITASEPPLTSQVRPSDVATFQKIGAPYQVGGTWYVPAHEPDYDETGVASWYGNEFHGKPTANGEIFDMNIVSGAHPTLPIPSLVEVTNLSNGRSLIVRINDRGPFVGSRLIDMSSRGAELLGFRQQGHANVRVRYVGPADAEPRVTPANLTMASATTPATGTKPLEQAAVAAPFAPTQVAAATSPQPTIANQNQQAFVQVGAFSQIANAQRLRDQAASLGPVQVVETTNAQGSPLYRVVLGPIANRAEALVKVQEMNESGITGARVMASLN